MPNSKQAHTKKYVIGLRATTTIVTLAFILLTRAAGAFQQTGIKGTAKLSPVIPAKSVVQANTSNPVVTAPPAAQQDQTPATSSTAPSTSTTTTTSTAPSTSTTTNTTTSTGSNSTSGTSGSGSGGSTPTGGTSGGGSSSSTSYKDGTYYADGSYQNGAGQLEKIGITLVLSGGVVTDTSAVNEAKNPTSKTYENDFIANYKSYVVGKSISGLSLGKISTSSLTPNGFNDAVSQIKTKAV